MNVLTHLLTEEEKVEGKSVWGDECISSSLAVGGRENGWGETAEKGKEWAHWPSDGPLAWMDDLLDDTSRSLGKRGVENMSMMTMLSRARRGQRTHRQRMRQSQMRRRLLSCSSECVLCCLTQTATLLLLPMNASMLPTYWNDYDGVNGSKYPWMNHIAGRLHWLACCCFETGLISEWSFFQHTILFTVKCSDGVRRARKNRGYACWSVRWATTARGGELWA